MDPNLRLALIDELHTARHGYDWMTDVLRAVYEASDPTTPWETFEDQIEPVPELEAFIRALPLDLADLATIEELELDGDREVYMTFPCWWDSGDHFVIRDLTGLQACTGLRRLSLGQGLIEDCALAPLAALEQLEQLSLCTSGRYLDPAALLECPALRRVEVFNIATGPDDWVPVLEQLRARGVVAGGPG